MARAYLNSPPVSSPAKTACPRPDAQRLWRTQCWPRAILVKGHTVSSAGSPVTPFR
jgi:hypothetical protein